MSFDIPDDRRYLASHEWILLDGDTARVGITDFAQDELGDVVFVELPAVGGEIIQQEAFGVIESIKAVSDLYAPASGPVTAVNETLEEAPERVNDSPYQDGWLIEVDLIDESELDTLLSADRYRDEIH